MDKYFKKTTGWLMVMALLAVGCSEDDAPVSPENGTQQPTRTLTFKVEVPGTGNPDTRAHWVYSEEYDGGSTLGFYWDGEEDCEIDWIRYTGSGTEGDGTYPETSVSDESNGKGSLTFDNDNSEMTAGITVSGDYDETKDKIFLLFATDPTITTGADKTTANAVVSINATTQRGENTNHLKPSMCMYGEYSGDGKVVKLRHIPAVLRFIVTNIRGEEVKLSSVSMVSSADAGFNTQANISYDSKGGYVIEPITTTSTKTLDISITDVEDDVELGYYSLENNSKVSLYQMVMPTFTEEMEMQFKIQCVQAFENGEPSEYSSYTTLVLDGAMIQTKLNDNGTQKAALCSGYYYTFHLLLDDKLTLEGVSIEDWTPGDTWNGEGEVN